MFSFHLTRRTSTGAELLLGGTDFLDQLSTLLSPPLPMYVHFFESEFEFLCDIVMTSACDRCLNGVAIADTAFECAIDTGTTLVSLMTDIFLGVPFTSFT